MRNLRGERGSLPLALLAVIIVTGLMIVVLSTVVTGQRHTRFDQGYEQSLQIAEVGLDRMSHLVQRHAVDDGAVRDGTVSGGSYVVEAEVDGDGVWTVTATGEIDDGPSRTVERRIAPEPLFDVAAFGRFFADFNGGNAADSYQSGELDDDGAFVQGPPGASYICDGNSGSRLTDTGSGHSDVVMCDDTGVGVVATNGDLDLKGNAFDKADAAEVHFAKDEWIDEEALDDATGDCLMGGGRCEDDKVSYFRDPLTLDPVEIPGELTSAGRFPEDHGSSTLAPGEHRFTDVTLDEDTVIDGTPDDPTILYVTGQVSIPNHHAVNFETGPDGNPQPRPPGSLLIFSQSDGSQALQFGNHASVSAAIYAPEGGFSGGAQGNVYGSLIAGSINNNGGWNFHYDEALSDMPDYAPLVPQRWAER